MSVVFFMERLRPKSLDWLYLQHEANEIDNGPACREAVIRLIREKESKGEQRSKKRKACALIVSDEIDRDYVVRPVPSGPKGQTSVCRIHKSVFTGD